MASGLRTRQAAVQALPLGIAVLCQSCAAAVPLILFVANISPARQVHCPACAADVVLRDAW